MKKELLHKFITEAFKETKEATGTGGGYGFSTPAFSMWSEDNEAKSEYKRPKVKEVREDEEYCDSCDSVKSKCVCPKKIEANEATDSGSVGPYDANSFQNINMKGNTTKGQGRSWKQTQIPGGGFVSVKKKCKTFPYCNQGDIKSLNISKTAKLNEAIKNVSLRTGLSENEIKTIILSSFGGNL